MQIPDFPDIGKLEALQTFPKIKLEPGEKFTAQVESDKEMIERGSLPESCEFNVDNALAYTNLAHVQISVNPLTAYHVSEALRLLKASIKDLEEIKAKIKKARG